VGAGSSYLVENGLGLTSVTGLLAVITTLTLGEKRSLSCLVLCQFSVYARFGGDAGLLTGNLVLGVLLAVLALAVGSSGLGNVDLITRVRKGFPGSSRLRDRCV
jgi:hypothetical protein